MSNDKHLANSLRTLAPELVLAADDLDAGRFEHIQRDALATSLSDLLRVLRRRSQVADDIGADGCR